MNQLEEGTTLSLQFEKRGGLIPVVVQDYSSGEILMLGYTNREAFDLTLERGQAHFYSTSRQKLWKKGETSGDVLRVDEVLVDCDQDALVYKVTPLGQGVCHTFGSDGSHRPTCFYRRLSAAALEKIYP
jgi:phosphoribosyl-AMP cyclohydrolase